MVISRTRKAKHLAYYHGPASILSNVDGRERQYNLEYQQGKVFKRDIGMLITEKRLHHAGTREYDPAMEGLAKTNAKAYSKGDAPSLRRRPHPLQKREAGQSLVLCEMQKDIDKKKTPRQRKENNNDMTPSSLNPVSILSKQHSVVQRPC